MRRRFVTQSEAEQMIGWTEGIYHPVVEQFGLGCLGITATTEYYLVPDDDPRAGTEETVDA